MGQPKLYLCYSINDFFAREAGISLTGFFENNPDYEPEEVFVLDYGILPANKQRLNEVANRYGRRITYLDARPVTSAVKREFPHLKGWRGTMAPNAKAFVDQIFPDYVERLLFIDVESAELDVVAGLGKTVDDVVVHSAGMAGGAVDVDDDGFAGMQDFVLKIGLGNGYHSHDLPPSVSVVISGYDYSICGADVPSLFRKNMLPTQRALPCSV